MMPPEQHASVRNEQVLSRQLSTVQQTMMAIGGAIGTGLFLATSASVKIAGPSIIVSYVLMAGISLLLGRALREMAVAHPTAGAFGVYAGIYISPFAGFAVRVSYWLMEVIATGGHLIAVSIYMKFWFPEVPGAIWVVAFGTALLYLNSRSVRWLGRIEYWFAMIKVVALLLFFVLGMLLLFGATGQPAIGVRNLHDDGGFAPFGITGIWLGCCFALYSFIGVEIVGVTSGEATDPARTIPRAARRLVFGLSGLYIGTITLLTALIPWRELIENQSPFVSVLGKLGIPAAAGVMNFVVLSAALSSSNANLYLISRTLFSLARADFAPQQLGEINRRGAPARALWVSAIWLGAAALLEVLLSQDAYFWYVGISLFGAMFVWLMIFVTHIAFRRAAHGPRASRRPALGSYIGALVLVALMVSTWWVARLHSTLLSGAPWLVALIIGYRLSLRLRKPRG